MTERWDVKTVNMGDDYVSEFDHTFRLLSLVNASGVEFGRDTRADIRDLVLELVAEIERLETAVIARDDTIEWLNRRIESPPMKMSFIKGW